MSTDRPRETAFGIRYLTRYGYDAEVVDNLNALRVRPAANSRQRVEEFSVRVSPDARLQRHDDYFGTEVVEFEVTRPHRELAIDVRCQVATLPPPEPPRGSWSAAASPEYRESAGEFLLQTDDAAGHPVLEALLAGTAGQANPLALALTVAEAIPDRFEYRRGATYVDSPLAAVLDGGAGVCQDFVHLGLCLLRHHGLAARYVSGYLFTDGGRDAGEEPEPGASVEVDTHAWIEALIPEESGDTVWVGVDPTNRSLSGVNHVKIGHGRHYGDVPPIKGVYRGTATATLEASVTMTRLAGPQRSASTRA
ncbi:MAG TPA: transglutaminase family protein [Solirubrobacteraceae bacterium]|nr:transglutaminase family protein [Solirubrobacteraceae bacterium]